MITQDRVRWVCALVLLASGSRAFSLTSQPQLVSSEDVVSKASPSLVATAQEAVAKVRTKHTALDLAQEKHASAGDRAPAQNSGDQLAQQVIQSLAIIRVRDAVGSIVATGTAVILSQDGLLLTVHSLAADLEHMQVQLADGTQLERPEFVSSTAGRSLDILRVSARHLTPLPLANKETIAPGQTVYAIYNSGGWGWVILPGQFRTRIASSRIPGIGESYDLLQFTAQLSPRADGGVLVDGGGHALGLLIFSAQPGDQSIAIPIDQVTKFLGSISPVLLPKTDLAHEAPPSPPDLTAQEMPPLIPMITAAEARPLPPPPSKLAQILSSFQTYFVKSDTIYMERETLEGALRGRPEFSAWNLQLAGRPEIADVVIEVRLPFLTWEWNYRMIHRQSGRELGTGKVKALLQDSAAPGIAGQIVDSIKAHRPLPVGFQPAAGVATATMGKQWKVKFVSGAASLPQNKSLGLSITPEQIVGHAQGTVLFVIPNTQVTAVAYNNIIKNPKDPWYEFWSGGGSSDNALGAIVVLLVVGAIGEGILEPMKATEHYIRINWVDSGQWKNVLLRTEGNDYKLILNQLSDATHKDWIDVPAQVQKSLDKIEKARHDSEVIHLDRKVHVGWAELAPGDYSFVFVEKQANAGEAYFFLGRQFVARAPAVAERPSAMMDQYMRTAYAKAYVEYREENGNFGIAEVRTSLFIFRLVGEPIETR